MSVAALQCNDFFSTITVDNYVGQLLVRSLTLCLKMIFVRLLVFCCSLFQCRHKFLRFSPAGVYPVGANLVLGGCFCKELRAD